MHRSQEGGKYTHMRTNTQMFTFVCTYYVYKQTQYL